LKCKIIGITFHQFLLLAIR